MVSTTSSATAPVATSTVAATGAPVAALLLGASKVHDELGARLELRAIELVNNALRSRDVGELDEAVVECGTSVSVTDCKRMLSVSFPKSLGVR